MRKFRGLVGGAFVVAATLASAAQAEEITVLTWNHVGLADSFYKPAIAEFEAAHPGVKVNWLDRKGTEFNAFVQTQLVGGTPPDVVEFQGMLWLEYQDQDLLVDLAPYLKKDAGFEKGFEPAITDYWKTAGGVWGMPAQWGKTLLHYNKPMFNAAGIDGPPKDWDELLADIAKTTDPAKQRAGFVALNFDWSFWPLFAMHGIDLLDKDLHKAAFNTPKMKEVMTELAEATKRDEISKTSWTGRWVEPNSEFGDGRAAMYLTNYAAYGWFKNSSNWVSPETLGTAQWPGGWAVPDPQGWSILKPSKDPDLAWEFVRFITSKKWAMQYGRLYALLSGNKEADAANIDYFKKADPNAARVLQTNLEALDKITGVWKTPRNAEIMSVFWPEIQSALLGQKPVDKALSDAERNVNHVLAR
jgi:ABC-type glycerol-3-phosphate transport system substrate-binding protein